MHREHITAPYMRTATSLAMFHVALSLVVATTLAFTISLCSLVWSMVQSSTYFGWNSADSLNKFLALIPGIGVYRGNIYGVETTTVLIAAVWAITLTEAYYEHVNQQISHRDHVVANTLEQFPPHGSLNYEDELIIARAFLNYSLGVSMTLNPVRNKFEPRGNSMNASLPDDPRRCPMLPFIKIPQVSVYAIEGKRQRYQVDAVVYRMLIDDEGRMFSSYVEAFVECMVEAESHIVALTSKRESMADLRIDLKPDSNTCASCSGWADFVLGGWLGVTQKVPHKAADTMVLVVIYMRGLASWLSIANMLGYADTHIQQVAKELVAQCVSLSKAVATIRRYSMPPYFYNTLDVITNVINTTLKQMTVYADAMLYSTFDTDFDTFRLLEKIYKPVIHSALP
ncbi:uncharacterized protein BXIN_3031 [Babesia sp. Xinjiang]|uniref:uncharacterized protein n=1 Tax=Babesia sp. Xinjiang TaxID=462227 RepID=UPI000A258E9E|nr:uncharacterized protein BXIN_3031 [Babesia sp. Xinjiang]ORM39402.1 hypothetical protein BXIN_3031 [Babesia sp. Xinjiang]